MLKNEYKETLITKLNDRRATIAIVGLGYVGLPLACAFAEVGYRVIGIDKDPGKVEGVNGGKSHVHDVPPSQVGRLVGEKRLRATEAHQAAQGADVAIIAVQTPIDEYRTPDLSHVRGAAAELARALPKGCLVILESTTYPGTTEEVVISEFRARGYEPGVDMFVAYSPERIDPGNREWNIANTPKIVSGLTPDSLELAIALYSSIVQKVVPVSNLRTGEITKLFENVFRCVNIALVNEFQLICDGLDIDVWEVIQACETKPFGFTAFYPGPGLGGHCVPVDPFFLAWKARERSINTEFIELSGRINAGMPNYVVRKIATLLNSNQKSVKGAQVGLLGVAYKKNTSDVRESPAIRLIELLLDEGANISYFDPHVPELKAGGRQFSSEPDLNDFLPGLDCAVVVADHDSIDWTTVLQYSPIVIDTRHVLGRLSPASTRSTLSSFD